MIEQIIETGKDIFGREVRFVMAPAGEYVAGAGTRIQDTDRWKVVTFIDGQKHSRAFVDWDSAEREFAFRLNLTTGGV